MLHALNSGPSALPQACHDIKLVFLSSSPFLMIVFTSRLLPERPPEMIIIVRAVHTDGVNPGRCSGLCLAALLRLVGCPTPRKIALPAAL